MDPLTLGLLMGGTSLATGGLNYLGSKQAAGTQSAAAQQSGIFGMLAQQQALQQAKQMAEQGAAAGREYYDKGRADLLNQGKIAADTTNQFYGQGIGYQQPYMQAGEQATNQLAQLYGPNGAYTQMPTIAQIEMDPSYAWRTQQGQQALLNATRAGVGGANAGSGAAGKAFINYGQNAASQEYASAYNRFMANRAQAVQGLQNLAGTGAGAAQTATGLAGSMGNALSGNQFNLGSNLGTMASNAGSTVAGAYTGAIPTVAGLASANPYGTAAENAAAARASGYVGGTSALGNALQGGVNGMLAYSMLNRMPQQATNFGAYGPQPTYNGL